MFLVSFRVRGWVVPSSHTTLRNQTRIKQTVARKDTIQRVSDQLRASTTPLLTKLVQQSQRLVVYTDSHNRRHASTVYGPSRPAEHPCPPSHDTL